MPVWVHGNTCLRMKVTGPVTGSCARLSTNTEVVIKPKPRRVKPGAGMVAVAWHHAVSK